MGKKAKYGAVNTARDKSILQHAAYEQAEVEGYEIDKKLSNKKGTVYRNKATGKVTIGFAGTQVSAKNWKQGAKDIMADIHIATATESSSEEFKKAERQYKSVVKKYGAENVDVTGHSLGGTKAAYLSHKYGVHAETFNQGASPVGGEGWDMSNVTAHITTGDIVPLGARRSGKGAKIHGYHQRIVDVIKDELKRNILTPSPVTTAINVESQLHSSAQFVPKGKSDASMMMEKPKDSKPVPKPAPAPVPTPAPIPTPAPAPTPKANPPAYVLSHSRYARHHLGSGGV